MQPPRHHVPIYDFQRLVAATSSVLLLLSLLIRPVWSHGRLVNPPSRSSMWRYGFRCPRNYNDMELFCGGFQRQWTTNGGQCGICGDPFDAPDPKANEVGGKYAKSGIIVKTYYVNSTRDMVASVQLTANHKGHFEFRICPYDSLNPVKEVTQECLDRHQLQLQDNSGTQFYVPIGSGNGMFEVPLRLPSDVSCERCLFQWIYKAANNWGRCDDGSGKIGCGPQEQFRACADIRIVGAPVDDTTLHTTIGPLDAHHEHQDTRTSGETGLATNTNVDVSWTFEAPTTTTPVSVERPDAGSNSGILECLGAGIWASVSGMRDWCRNNCNHQPPYCPPSHCICDGNGVPSSR